MLALVGTAGAVGAAPAAKLLPEWDASNEASAAAIDHSGWQSVLDAHLQTHPSGIARFDYGALKSAATPALAHYLTRMQAIDPREFSRAQQLPYWINLYNAVTVKVVADAYPVRSVRSIHRGWLPRTGPWNDVHLRVADRELTLNNIEHDILRPIWRDARIHYALNCASLGCPNLAAEAYTAANSDTLLDAGARAYVSHPRGVRFESDGVLVLSSIYDWFEDDFGGGRDAVFAHLIKHAEPDLARSLQNFDGRVRFEYDWRLNDP